MQIERNNGTKETRVYDLLEDMIDDVPKVLRDKSVIKVTLIIPSRRKKKQIKQASDE